VKGENRDLNPHVPGTDQWEAWDRGWLSGQGDNVAKMPSAKKGPAKGKKATSKEEPPETQAGTELDTSYEPPLCEDDAPEAAKLFDE